MGQFLYIHTHTCVCVCVFCYIYKYWVLNISDRAYVNLSLNNVESTALGDSQFLSYTKISSDDHIGEKLTFTKRRLFYINAILNYIYSITDNEN